jgi:hypothetical protein
MIATHLRMRKIARTKRERERERRDNERVEKECGEREGKRASGCVTTLKKMPVTRARK